MSFPSAVIRAPIVGRSFISVNLESYATMPPIGLIMPTTLFAKTSARLLRSTPNYIEVTAIIGLALAARLLWLPLLWRYAATPIILIAIVISLFLYGCLGQGKL